MPNFILKKKQVVLLQDFKIFDISIYVLYILKKKSFGKLLLRMLPTNLMFTDTLVEISKTIFRQRNAIGDFYFTVETNSSFSTLMKGNLRKFNFKTFLLISEKCDKLNFVEYFLFKVSFQIAISEFKYEKYCN